MASSCYDRRHRAIERRHDRVWTADRLRSETRARDRAESVLALMWSMPLSDVDSFAFAGRESRGRRRSRGDGTRFTRGRYAGSSQPPMTRRWVDDSSDLMPSFNIISRGHAPCFP